MRDQYASAQYLDGTNAIFERGIERALIFVRVICEITHWLGIACIPQ